MFKVTITSPTGSASMASADTLPEAMEAVRVAASDAGLTARYARRCAHCQTWHFDGSAMSGFFIDPNLKPWFEFRIDLIGAPITIPEGA